MPVPHRGDAAPVAFGAGPPSGPEQVGERPPGAASAPLVASPPPSCSFQGIVDDNTVIRMHYSDAGAFVGANVVNQDPAVFVALRDMMWAAAEPFSAWWARHGELHRSRQAA